MGWGKGEKGGVGEGGRVIRGWVRGQGEGEGRQGHCAQQQQQGTNTTQKAACAGSLLHCTCVGSLWHPVAIQQPRKTKRQTRPHHHQVAGGK